MKDREEGRNGRSGSYWGCKYVIVNVQKTIDRRHYCLQLYKEERSMRKLLSLFLAVAMMMAAVPAAFAAEPYTLDIWWVGNADNPEVREEVEAAINEYIEPKIDAHVSFHIVPWDDWKTEVVDVLTDKASRKAAKMDLVFTADWEYYPDLVEAKALTASRSTGTSTAFPPTRSCAFPRDLS